MNRDHQRYSIGERKTMSKEKLKGYRIRRSALFAFFFDYLLA